jgi:hypothetical protein
MIRLFSRPRILAPHPPRPLGLSRRRRLARLLCAMLVAFGTALASRFRRRPRIRLISSVRGMTAPVATIHRKESSWASAR